MTFGYDADVARLLGVAANSTLRDHGRSLCTDLTLRRLRTESVDKLSLL